MEAIKSFDLFISHTWHISLDYTIIVEMLNREPNFYWRNYSFPEFDPVINPETNAGKKRLTEELDGQIKHAHAVVIIANMFNDNPFWIEKEIEIAKSHKIPIILIKADDNEVIPNHIQYEVKKLVKGDVTSIISAIRML